MNRVRVTGGAVAVLLSLFACAREESPPPAPPPNVVLVVANGFGTGAWSLTRLVAEAAGDTLALDGADALAFLAPGDGERLVLDERGAADAWSRGGGEAGAARQPLGRELRAECSGPL